jgi:hypothetical protein
LGNLDLLIAIDKFISRSGLTHGDSIKDLTNALTKTILDGYVTNIKQRK